LIKGLFVFLPDEPGSFTTGLLIRIEYYNYISLRGKSKPYLQTDSLCASGDYYNPSIY
jgi:hypothetical protein